MLPIRIVDTRLTVINAELLHALGARVDQAKAIGLARLELELGNTGIWCAGSAVLRARVVHLAVDQVVVTLWQRRIGSCRSHNVLHNVIVVSVVPIGKHHGSEILIVVSIVVRTVNDHRAEKTTSSLRAVVRVIPRCAVEISSESVRERRTGCDGALHH